MRTGSQDLIKSKTRNLRAKWQRPFEQKLTSFINLHVLQLDPTKRSSN